MVKKLPSWVVTYMWMGLLVLIAFLLGQFVSLCIAGNLTVPRKINLSKTVKKKEEHKTSYSQYREDILPIFGPKKSNNSSNKKLKNSDNLDDNSQGKSVEWDQLLSAESPSIKLKGTVIGSSIAIALLEVNGKDITLSINQEAGSYKVEDITKTTVTFKKGNSEKVLSMNLDSDTRGRQSSVNRSSFAQRRRNIDLTGIISYRGDKRIVDRRKFDALLKPPSRLAHDMKFIPNSKNGKPYGIKVSYLKPGSFFTKVGLRSGDVLIRTNNKDIKSVEDSFYAYQAFKNEDHLTLEVDRNGKKIRIPIDFR